MAVNIWLKQKTNMQKMCVHFDGYVVAYMTIKLLVVCRWSEVKKKIYWKDKWYDLKRTET